MVKPRRFYVLSADIEAHGHTGGCPGCAALASHAKATKPHNDECRETGDVLMEPGNRDDEQVAVRRADASGGDIRENQDEEDRMRDIHIGKRGSVQVKNNLTS